MLSWRYHYPSTPPNLPAEININPPFRSCLKLKATLNWRLVFKNVTWLARFAFLKSEMANPVVFFLFPQRYRRTFGKANLDLISGIFGCSELFPNVHQKSSHHRGDGGRRTKEGATLDHPARA